MAKNHGGAVNCMQVRVFVTPWVRYKQALDRQERCAIMDHTDYINAGPLFNDKCTRVDD